MLSRSLTPLDPKHHSCQLEAVMGFQLLSVDYTMVSTLIYPNLIE